MKKILYLTDLYYQAKGRNYYEEDLYITKELMDSFDIVLGHPKNTESFEKDVDLIVFRNTGGISGFKKEYQAFVERVKEENFNTFNEFTGNGDMAGKQYLLDLTKLGYPVIPTIDSIEDLDRLPKVEKYVIKPKDGADSIGLEFLSKRDLLDKKEWESEMLIQPAIDFDYEVSFYYLNDQFQYALYAPDKNKRWELKQYSLQDGDIHFADRFIQWNTIDKGIQRVDACRTKDGELLLVELEDLNPYLSLLELDPETREKFIKEFIEELRKLTLSK